MSASRLEVVPRLSVFHDRQARRGNTELRPPAAKTQGILCRERIPVKVCIADCFLLGHLTHRGTNNGLLSVCPSC
jgi:hypothetical protein